MEDSEVGEPPTVVTAPLAVVIKYLENVSSVIFEEDLPCTALNKVS